MKKKLLEMYFGFITNALVCAIKTLEQNRKIRVNFYHCVLITND